ncbi:MAG: hypothetical protein PHU95_02250 [Candidatus Thermoplasmatota archaeon]|nr:hypothetical protein [Candidatus Thermoplasmatota archaeon]MDD5778253.1 hypothetical protein [Candidatus Thermoplasmatota archaeon]
MKYLLVAVASSFIGGTVVSYIAGDEDTRHRIRLATPLLIVAFLAAARWYSEGQS